MKLIATINGLSQADIFSKPLNGQLVQKDRHSGDFMFICRTGIKSDCYVQCSVCLICYTWYRPTCIVFCFV